MKKLAVMFPLVATTLMAQSPANLEDELTKLLNTLVVSASKTSQSVKDAPNVISVFTSDVLASYNMETVNDLLFKQPGFARSQDYKLATASSRGVFEGWNQAHMLLLVGGVAFNTPVYGSAFTNYHIPQAQYGVTLSYRM